MSSRFVRNIFKAFIIMLGIIFLVMLTFFFTTFFVVKHVKLKNLIESEIEDQLGINVTIEKLIYSPLLTRISVEGVTIHNPQGFKERELAYLNSIRLVWDPWDLIIYKKPTIYLCAVDLARLNIVKNEHGKINLKELMPVSDRGKMHHDRTPFFFDVLILSVGQVSYTQYIQSGSKVHHYTIGIKEQTFLNLQDENEVVKMVIYKAIQNSDIGKMIDLTISPLSGVSGTIDAAWGTAKTGARSAMQIATMPFHLIFGK